MKYKKILAAALCVTMLSGTALTASADTKFEAGLPAQPDSSDQLVANLPPLSDLPAFPGAEGYGEFVTGGRGGKVIHVTNLNTSGEGSLAAALHNGGKTDEPRIIVFDVSGTIWLDKTVAYKKSIKNVTIAGQTAPGEGITLTGENFYLNASENVIIRYIHFRHGQAEAKDDSFYVQGSKYIMVDHCSFTYGSDEDCSARQSNNLTIQWSIISDGVRTHSMGGLQEWNSETIHHCLWGNQNDRNPKAKGIMDFTNNVVYNWGDYPFVAGGNSGGQGWGNVVNNYFIAGLDTKNPDRTIVRSNGKYFLYLGGNLLDSNKNGVLDGVNTGADMIAPGAESGNDFPDRFTFPNDYTIPLVLIKNRMNMPSLNHIDSAQEAYAKVTEFAGASLYHGKDGTTVLQHDAIDTEILEGVKNQTGKILLNNAESHDRDGVKFDQDYLNSRPEIDVNDPSSEWYRPDADQDGMPDAWEKAHGLDPDNPEDRNGIAPSGYTWIEEYLNELAAPGFPADDYQAAARLAAESGRKERAYVLRLENYKGETAEFEGIYGENQILVPFAPVAEYLGYKLLAVTENVVTVEYPFQAASGLLNLDVTGGAHTLKAGDRTYDFSTWTNPNEAVRSHNGMLYVPVNWIALGMGAVYEQTIGDDNAGYITIQDAESYKGWHNDDGIRNARKKAAPAMVVQAVSAEDQAVQGSQAVSAVGQAAQGGRTVPATGQAAADGFRILFDKEAALADGSAAVTITADRKEYTARAEDANIWGSHKVAEFKYSDFKAADGTAFQWNGTAGFGGYTVKIAGGAFGDYYNDALVNEETEVSVDAAAQMGEREAALKTAQEQSAQIAASGSTVTEGDAYVPDNGEALTVSEALKAMYRLLSIKEINAITSDQINFDGDGAADASSGSVVTPGSESKTDAAGQTSGTDGRTDPAGQESGSDGKTDPAAQTSAAAADTDAQSGAFVWVWVAAGLAAAAIAVFAVLKLRGKGKDRNKK